MHSVVETLSAQGGSPVYLCLNATRTVTTAVAVQFVAQALHVLGDWIREREPGAVVGEIIRDARIWIGKPLVLHAGPSHFERYDTVGLRGAVARVPAELRPQVPSIRAELSFARYCSGKSAASLHCLCRRRRRGRSRRLPPVMREMDSSWPRLGMTSTSCSWRDWRALSGLRSSLASQPRCAMPSVEMADAT